MEHQLSIIRPLANFHVQHGTFIEAHVDQLRTSEEQEETIRQYVAKIIGVAGANVETTILLHMIDTVTHAAMIINNGSKEVISVKVQAQYPDHAMIKLYKDFSSSLTPTVQPQDKPAPNLPNERIL